MKKNKKKRKTIIFSITTFLLLVMVYVSLHLERRVNFLENGIKTITSVLSSAVMIPFKAFNSEKNVDQSESYTIQKNINKSLESEIEELKDTLSLNKTFTEYECINATVLTRNKNYWLNTIIIDKGLDNNIGMDMAVITKNGLIGKIVKVYKNSSEVKLITADDINYKVSVLLSTESGDYYGVLSGYSKNGKLLKIKGVDKDSNMLRLTTSRVFSGNGDGKNNPDNVGNKDNGPIPPGKYYVIKRQSGGIRSQIKDWTYKLWNDNDKNQ